MSENAARSPRTERSSESKGALRHLGFSGDDAALVAALHKGHPGAPAALFDRYGAHVQGVLASVIGVDQELPDLLHEVFARAFSDFRKLDDPERLKAWLTTIAVFTARGCIRRRKRGKWLRFWAPGEVPEVPDGRAPFEAREALGAIYEILEKLPTKERIAFSLRFINGLELTEVASACEVSLATIKRHIAKAEAHFLELARDDGVLSHYLEESPRWRER